MLKLVPSFYPQFHCIASACRHSCCVGWEVDIDEESARRYQKMSGALGEELRSKIDWSEKPHFRLGEGERCPFLDEQNLCQLILAEGEEFLCQICTDHPRFRSYFADRIEEGLGLCCEEATRILLTAESPITLLDEEIPGEELEADEIYLQLREERDQLWSIIQNQSKPLEKRVCEAYSLFGIEPEQQSFTEDLKLLLSLEIMDETWKKDLEALLQRPVAQWSTAWDRDGERILWYLLFRYYLSWGLERWEEEFALRFGVFSLRLLGGLYGLTLERKGELTLEDRVEYIRRWSAELEYSEENLDTIAAAIL